MHRQGLADYLIAEADLDLSLGGFSRYRRKAGLFRSVGIDPVNVSLEAAHQEQQPEDHEGPRDEDAEEQYLIRSHVPQCRRR